MIDWLVNELEHLKHSVAFSIDPVSLFVQVPQKAVLELTHQIAETEKDVRLEILGANLGLIAKLPEAIVQNCNNLIHSLNILKATVEPCIDKQNP